MAPAASEDQRPLGMGQAMIVPGTWEGPPSPPRAAGGDFATPRNATRARNKTKHSKAVNAGADPLL